MSRTLTTPLARIIRRWIIAAGHGTTANTFVGFLPNTPNDAILVLDTVGKMDGRLMATGEKIEHPGFQVSVRGTDYPAVWGLVKDISLMFDDAYNQEVIVPDDGTYRIQNISRTGTPLYLGVEEEGTLRRFSFSINAIATLRKIT